MKRKAELSMILARDLNGAIGKGNKIPWSCQNDMEYYKLVTKGYKYAICGRKTYDSLPPVVKNRHQFIVVTNNLELTNGIGGDGPIYTCLSGAIKLIKNLNYDSICIGGTEIYRQLLPMANRVYLTTIYTAVNCADTHFLDFDGEWEAIHSCHYSDCFTTELIRVNNGKKA